MLPHKLIVINIIGGPGVGKTTLACGLYAHLKKLNYSIEYVPEYAKWLVWTGRFDKLNNQYAVTGRQHKLLSALVGKVKYVITDSSLLSGLYYNTENPNNVCDTDKVYKAVHEWNLQYDNINIFLERGTFEYEQAGRYHTCEQAILADQGLEKIYSESNQRYSKFPSSPSYESLVEYIILHTPRAL